MEKVFVSGGSGFISLHLISKLIQEGYQVRTSLRSLDRKQEVIDAVEKEVSTEGMLEFCELDLLKDEDVKKIEKEIQSALNTKDVFMISAFTGKGTRELLNKLETEVCKS